MTPRETFALYIEGSGPGARASLARQAAGDTAFEAARAQWSGRLHDPWVSEEDVRTMLGPPDVESPGIVGYELRGRPGFVYAFHFDPTTGRELRAGYSRVGPRRKSPPVLGARELASINATSEELKEWLGEPLDRDGWWPIEIWHYPNGLSIELRHGVAEAP